MCLRDVKQKLPLAPIVLVLLFVSCLGPRETSFYSNFSTRDLVERNQAAAGLNCEPIGGGGGAGVHSWGGGFGESRFDSHKSDSFACRFSADSNFDEGRLILGIKADIERLIRESGLQITDRGSSGPANFFFAYTEKNLSGRVEISGKAVDTNHYVEVNGKRISSQYYNVLADLHEQAE